MPGADMTVRQGVGIGLIATGAMTALAGAALYLLSLSNDWTVSNHTEKLPVDNLTGTSLSWEELVPLIGSSVINRYGEQVGTLEDVLLDDDGEIFTAVSVGGFLGIGDHVVAIGSGEIEVDPGLTAVRVNLSKKQLDTLPEYDWPYGPMHTANVLPKLVDQLKAAAVAFNAPDRLLFDKAVRIQFALAPLSATVGPEDALDQNLVGAVQIRDGVKYALRMRAELSGPDFRIDPPGPQMRTVLPDRATDWSWMVTPIRPGEERILTLSPLALLKHDDEILPPFPVETFQERIFVDVSSWDQVRLYAQEVTPVHGLVVGLCGSAFGVFGWLWGLRRPNLGQGEKGGRSPLGQDNRVSRGLLAETAQRRLRGRPWRRS